MKIIFEKNAKKKDDIGSSVYTWFNQGVIFFNFQARMMEGTKKWPKKYNIDYFGNAVNLEFKFKLNFDEEVGRK